MQIAKFVAIVGNMLISLWLVFNAIDSGFRGTQAEIASSVFLIFLLGLDTILLGIKAKNR